MLVLFMVIDYQHEGYQPEGNALSGWSGGHIYTRFEEIRRRFESLVEGVLMDMNIAFRLESKAFQLQVRPIIADL